jgi:hypothetical protein
MLGFGLILTAAKTIFGFGSNIISNWLDKRAQIKTAELDVKLAALNNKAALLRDKEKYNSDWEMASIANSTKGLKYISFALFAGPLVLTFICPFVGLENEAKLAWAALNAVPQYWQTGYMAVTGGIWGISTFKDLGGIRGIFGLTKSITGCTTSTISDVEQEIDKVYNVDDEPKQLEIKTKPKAKSAIATIMGD